MPFLTGDTDPQQVLSSQFRGASWRSATPAHRWIEAKAPDDDARLPDAYRSHALSQTYQQCRMAGAAPVGGQGARSAESRQDLSNPPPLPTIINIGPCRSDPGSGFSPRSARYAGIMSGMTKDAAPTRSTCEGRSARDPCGSRA